jgi:hypothetical protein
MHDSSAVSLSISLEYIEPKKLSTILGLIGSHEINFINFVYMYEMSYVT